MARAFFILMPALLLGGVAAYFHPAIGALIAVSVVGLGIQITQARSERDETSGQSN